MKGDEVVEVREEGCDHLLLLTLREADKAKESVLSRNLHVVLGALVDLGMQIPIQAIILLKVTIDKVWLRIIPG